MQTDHDRSVRAFIQARMNSTRFPGKMLAPFHGQAIIAHVIAKTAQVIPTEKITVATSTEVSDDPLALYVQALGISVFRGPLDDVFERFLLCLEQHPCSWFFRVCGDSPLLDSTLLKVALAHAGRTDVDLITNVFPRTFPRGHSMEMVNSATFSNIDPGTLSAEEREHLTRVFYNHPADFDIVNIESTNPHLAERDFAVDSLQDLARLEQDPDARTYIIPNPFPRSS